MILGFGSTEQQFLRDEETAIKEYIERRWTELGLHYFTDEFVEELRQWLKERGDETRAKAAEYKTAEHYPERYSSYYATVLADASHIAVVLRVLHTNRRHAMSPDGWACLSERAVFAFDNFDLPLVEAA
jgi:hypothetical protein